MFKKFDDGSELPLVIKNDKPHLGFLHLSKRRRFALVLVAVAAILGLGWATAVMDRCDSMLRKWGPSISSKACECDALLVEDGSSLLVSENGDRLCIR